MSFIGRENLLDNAFQRGKTFFFLFIHLKGTPLLPVVEQLITSYLATPCWWEPTRLKQLSTVANVGFQFGLYNVVAPLSFLRSISLASFPGYPIDENRWSENQSTANRYQSIKLVNWYRLVSVNRRSIDNHTKFIHRLASIGTVPRNRRHAHYLSDHPPFLGSPGDKTGNRFLASQRKEYTPLHVYWKSPGRGLTKYKMHRQRLYHLCCFEVNVGEVFVHCKQKEGGTRRQYCSPVDNKMKCVYIYYVQSCVFYASIPFPSIYNQSIPIYLSIGIDNRYQSITTRIFAIDWSSLININRLIDIDWYWLISIVIDYRFYRLDTPGSLTKT